MSGSLIMTRGPLRKLLGAVSILLITLIMLEVAVRIWGYSQRHMYDPIYPSRDRTIDIPYIHKPDLVEARARGLAVINTDSLGLRAKIAGALYGAKQPNEYRIAPIGDSYTFGEGVTRTENTHAQVLEDTLNRRQQAVAVKTLNFGASAYSVKQMVATLQSRTPDIQPDLVLMAIMPDDFNLAGTPVVDWRGYFVDRNSSFLLHDLPVRAVFRNVHLTYGFREISSDWSFPSPDIGEMVSESEIPETYKYVRQFKKVAEEHGLSYVIVLLPRMRQRPWGRVSDELTRARIAYIALSSLQDEFTEEPYRASRFDPHPSAAVHHRIGEALADYVQHQPEFTQ